MFIGDFLNKRLFKGTMKTEKEEMLTKLFWEHMRKWDEKVTPGTWYSTDVLENMLEYANQEYEQKYGEE